MEGTPLMWDGALQSQESVLICLWLVMEPWGSLSEIPSVFYKNQFLITALKMEKQMGTDINRA